MNDFQTHDLIKELNLFFQSKVKMPRMRMGEQQEIETVINEEALLMAMFLRNEGQSWKLRIAPLICEKLTGRLRCLPKSE